MRMLYYGMVGPRVYGIEEANALVPDLERIFDELDGVRAEIRAVKLRITALEMIWGDAVRKSDNPDHGELQHHLEEMTRLQAAFEEITRKVLELDGQLKGLDPPLVDFYGIQRGFLILWCWRRGDASIDHWHNVDEGFAGRQPISCDLE